MLRERLIGNGTTISRYFGLYDWQDCTCLMHHYRNGQNTHNDFIKISR